VPTGNNPAGEVAYGKKFVNARFADACVLRRELDGDAETLLERNVADFLTGGLGAHFLKPPRKA
jgi:hypothetical protein